MENIFIKATTEKFDAIVVGSGMSGGWAAKELCEKGLKTLMIERGKNIEHRKDYVGEAVPPWKFRNRGTANYQLVEDQYSIQRQCYAFSDANKQFFSNDRDLPYSTPENKPFSWIRGDQIGGRSLLWARQSYRLSDYDFTANLRDGQGIDWPIRYKDLAPWYSYVERFAGISGSIENIPTLPDGEFLPPFEFNTVELALKKKFNEKYPDRHMIMGRCAHLTKPQPHHTALGRMQCQARAECAKGCSFGAYFSTQSATLPAALLTNNLSIATRSIVQSVIYDAKTNRAIGVRVIDADTMEEREYFAKIIFLCASTLATTQIMLNSHCKTFPNGIANSSGVLGHYLMDHLYGSGAYGRIEGFEEEYYSGRRPTQPIIPNFRNVTDKHPDFFRGYYLFGGAFREHWTNFAHKEGFGAELKKQIHNAGSWQYSLHGSGEMLPRYDNQVSLHSTLKDKWGIAQLHIDASFSENDYKINHDIADTAAEILTVLGVKDISKQIVLRNEDRPFGLSIHEMGTARMGRDPKKSVLNAFNQTHDIPNLFVTDGSCMTSSASQNPSLTYMALTARACDYAVTQFKLGKI